MNSLLILIVICSSADALVKTWSRTIKDTTCNYSFTYEVAEKFEADEMIGEAFICASTETCVRTISYSKIVYGNPEDDDGEEEDEDEIDQNWLINVVELTKNGNKQKIFQNIRHVNESAPCTIKPGYKGQIVKRTQFQRIKGNYEEVCLTSCDDCVETKQRTLVNVDRPIDNRLMAGKIRCKIEPAANFTEELKKCRGEVKETSMLQAINEAIQKVVVNAPLTGSITVKNATVSGSNAWAYGKCYNGIEKRACKACISYLAVQILEKCNKSLDARLYVNDCCFRYQDHKF